MVARRNTGGPSLRDYIVAERISGRQICDECNITERTLYSWRAAGLPMIRFAKQFWIRHDDLIEFLAMAPQRRAEAAQRRMLPPPPRPLGRVAGRRRPAAGRSGGERRDGSPSET